MIKNYAYFPNVLLTNLVVKNQRCLQISKNIVYRHLLRKKKLHSDIIVISRGENIILYIM